MTMLLFNPDTQEFEFSHVGDLNVPSNFLQFPNIEGGNFTKNGALDFLKILNFITGYNLTLVEGQARVLRPGDEPETQIAEVYVPNIQLEVRQFGDGLAIALTKLIKELFRLHGKG